MIQSDAITTAPSAVKRRMIHSCPRCSVYGRLGNGHQPSDCLNESARAMNRELIDVAERSTLSESMTFGVLHGLAAQDRPHPGERPGHPARCREKAAGFEKGDLVAVVAMPEGVLTTPQEVVASKVLDQIGAILREQGLSLVELIESGRDRRDELMRAVWDRLRCAIRLGSSSTRVSCSPLLCRKLVLPAT